MVIASLQNQDDASDDVTPMSIARNDLFTPKEKIELLTQLRADVTVAQQEGLSPAIALDEIDQAIAEVRQHVEDGVSAETLLRGDD